jgi:diguanylate cyclase (GGDEF)-like protein/PAS domain S-box-containing protein
MKWINVSKEQLEFESYNSLIVLSRMKLISAAVVLLSFLFIYFDWTVVRIGTDKVYQVTLISMHLICLLASVIFLIFYKPIVKHTKDGKGFIYTIPKVYFFLYVLVGALSSVNSQRYTGNIYSYIILSLIAGAVLTLKPLVMVLSYLISHAIFLYGISLLNDDAGQALTKQFNATIMIATSLFMSIMFYQHRMKEFFTKKKLKENEENFKKLFYSNPYPVFITRLEDGKVIKASKRAISLMGLTEDETKGYNSINWYIQEDNRLSLLEELKSNNSVYNRIVAYDFKGKRMWVTANYELIDYHGEKCILTGIMDITEIHRVEEELSRQASTDVLTGIMNRRMGMIKLEELMETGKTGFVEFVLCFVDINDLKKINDSLGHGEGDRYLMTFCDQTKEKIGEKDLFFRMGGDEFIIVFLNKSLSQAEMLWNKLIEHLGTFEISASHGMAYYSSGMELELEDIIERADKRMYVEKLKYRKEN